MGSPIKPPALIGIIADLHDNLANFKILTAREPDLSELWCAGDIGSPDTYAQIADRLSIPIRAVGGNLEAGIGLAAYGRLIAQFPHLTFAPIPPLAFSYAGYQVNVLHVLPDYPQSRGRARLTQLTIFGHTHRPDLRRSGQMWLVNPGALVGYPVAATYAILKFTAGKPYFELKRLYP